MGVALLSCNINTTSYIPETRSVSVTNDSVKIYTNILIKHNKKDLKNELKYYWYSAYTIGENYGGYNGYLLHGNYRKVNTNSRLLEQGTFNQGLKDGEWKYWNIKGELKKVENWNNGKLSEKTKRKDNESNPELNSINKSDSISADSSNVQKLWYRKIFNRSKKENSDTNEGNQK